MNYKTAGYISIALSIVTCCFFFVFLYYLEPSLPNNVSLRLGYQNLCCLVIIVALVLGVGLIIYSNLTEKQRLERQAKMQAQLASEEQARIAEEKRKQEDEIINKWINKKP